MCDLVGPLPLSEGYRYLLTIVCRTSRWVEALPLPDATSAHACRAFIDGWVRHFGIPLNMTCDNGTTFTSKLWKDINENLNTIVNFTPIYNPASLGSIERQHADIKNALRATLIAMGDEFQGAWARILPWILLARRTSFHGELKASPAQVVFGEDPRLPGDMIPPLGSGETLQDLLTRVKLNVDRPPAQTATHRKIPVYFPASAQNATHVYTKRAKLTPLGKKYDGPFLIQERLGKSCIKIVVGHYNNGKPRTEVRHWRSCWPQTLEEDTPTAARPKLGRPRTAPVP